MLLMLLDLLIWAQFQPNPGRPPFGPGGPGFGPGPGPQPVPPGAAGAMVAGMICYFVFLAVIIGFSIIVSWKIFSKAGEPGWASLIPIYNLLVMARICGRQEVFGLVYMIPCIGPVVLCFDLASAFGKDAGFAIGLFLLGIVFFPILAFGDAEHVYSRRSRRRSRHRDDDARPRRRRPVEDDDEDEDDRPRRRAIARDDDDDDEEERPRLRPSASDERIRRRPDDAPRPRRRPVREDDDDDETPPSPRPRRRPPPPTDDDD